MLLSRRGDVVEWEQGDDDLMRGVFAQLLCMTGLVTGPGMIRPASYQRPTRFI